VKKLPGPGKNSDAYRSPYLSYSRLEVRVEATYFAEIVSERYHNSVTEVKSQESEVRESDGRLNAGPF
jgi:hypothetical protein